MAARAKHLRPIPDSHARTADEPTPVVASYPGSSAQSPPLSWETLDRYKLVSPLAQGGMAEVFLAAQEIGSFSHRPVVIKRLYTHLAADPNLVQMFLDEARLLCRLEHPHVVRTFEAGVIEGHCCIAMEYLEGQTLAALLSRAHARGAMTPELAIEIVDAILSGLHYTHEARDEEGRSLQIVHRDVSPHNVLITNDGQVKLLDFGIAKTSTQESRTRTGIVKGKPAYIAPEQAKAEMVDRRADVWSAGVVLWEALTGVRLFKAETEAAAAMLTLTANIPPPSTLRRGVPAGVDAIALRALERNVEKRYQTAFDMRMDLQAVSPWSSKDTNALSKLMQSVFAEEIAEQRRLVSALMARSDCTPPSGRTSAVSGTRPAASVPEKARSTPPPPPAPHVAKAPPTAAATKVRKNKNAAFATAFVFSFALVLGTWALLAGTGTGTEQRAVAPSAAQPPARHPDALAAEPSPAPPVVAPPAERAFASSEGPAAPSPAPVAEIAAKPAVPAPSPVARITAKPEPLTSQIAAKPAAVAVAAPPLARAPSPAPAAQRAPVPPQAEPSPAPRESAPAEAFGMLTFDTTPWSVVSVGGRSLGQTPLIGVKLPAGSHTLTLKNPELGLETTYVVTIEAGKTQKRRIGLE